PGRQQTLRAREAAERRVTGPAQAAARPEGRLDLAAFQGRRWATRPRPHVDRIASAWLIKRFLDPAAEFVFAVPDELPAGAVPFDMAGVEIVHEGDLRDNKYPREEARGLDLVLRGLLAAVKDDHEALAQGLTLFD